MKPRIAGFRRPAALAIAVLGALSITEAFAGSAVAGFPTTYRPVTIDGLRMGAQLAAKFGCSNFTTYATIVYDDPTAKFHMWYQRCDTADTRRFADIFHAVSNDGLNFGTTGSLSFKSDAQPFAGPLPWAYGSAVEPRIYFIRVVKDAVAGYRILMANYPRFASIGDYAFNMSISDIGFDPNNLVLTHRGPLGPAASGANRGNNGGLGLVNGKLYYTGNGNFGGLNRLVRSDFIDWGIFAFPTTAGTGPWQITNIPSAAFPNPLAPFDPPPVLDLVNGTGYVPCGEGGGEGGPEAVVQNFGRVIQAPDGKLNLIYSLMQCSGTPHKQIYYAESPDNGVTWSTPSGVFPDPNQVTVDGMPAIEFFNYPELVVRGGERLLYFRARVSDPNYGNIYVGPSQLATAGPFALSTAVNPPGAGTVAPPGGATYPDGSVVPLTATAAPGFAFVRWSGAISSTSNPLSLTMNADKAVVANFQGIAPVLNVKLMSKQNGALLNRVYQYRVVNNSAYTARNVQMTGITAETAIGSGTIQVATPSAWPANFGDIAAGGYLDVFVTYNWPQSAIAAKITITLAADGPYTRSFLFLNVFR